MPGGMSGPTPPTQIPPYSTAAPTLNSARTPHRSESAEWETIFQVDQHQRHRHRTNSTFAHQPPADMCRNCVRHADTARPAGWPGIPRQVWRVIRTHVAVAYFRGSAATAVQRCEPVNCVLFLRTSAARSQFHPASNVSVRAAAVTESTPPLPRRVTPIIVCMYVSAPRGAHAMRPHVSCI